MARPDSWVSLLFIDDFVNSTGTGSCAGLRDGRDAGDWPPIKSDAGLPESDAIRSCPPDDSQSVPLEVFIRVPISLD